MESRTVFKYRYEHCIFSSGISTSRIWFLNIISSIHISNTGPFDTFCTTVVWPKKVSEFLGLKVIYSKGKLFPPINSSSVESCWDEKKRNAILMLLPWCSIPLLICTWILKSQVGRIRFDKLDFYPAMINFEIDFCRLHRQ